ncbi:DUF2269 family protein, partial [Rhizobium ruizarguesonis]
MTGLFWLPVVWIQIRLRDLALAAAAAGKALPPAYFSLYRIWFACGFPAFSAVIGVGLGLGALLHTVPMVYTALKFAGGAYLVWIAWKIASSRSLSEGRSGVEPMSFFAAAAFQWVNPKAWVMAVTAMATYTNPQLYLVSVLIVGLAFAA